jgi:flagellar rod assembly protein/muramidase FlgJ
MTDHDSRIPEVSAAWSAFAEAGLLAAEQDAEFGGMQLPAVVDKACFAYVLAANAGSAGYPLLTIANANLLIAHGSPAQVEAFVRPMLEGRYAGTMCLSEPQAGSSLADIRTTAIPQQGALGFVHQHGDAAKQAEAATGIPAAFMVSQAALETGWGRKEIRHADGTTSHNLFGIKAGANWKGPVAEVTTTEYINGRAQKVVAKFRAYGSYAESFADYAQLMKDSPRYQAAVGAAKGAGVAGTSGAASTSVAFANGLQKAGYATDPAYADKLTRVINTTLRLQRSLA